MNSVEPLNMRTRFVLLVLAILAGVACESAASTEPHTTRHSRPKSAPGPALEDPALAPDEPGSPAPDEPRDVRVEPLAGAEPPIFVLRGRGLGPSKLVFLHGMCGHGLGYAQSFQHAAAKKGTLIAPQADVVCGGGPGAKWSQDLTALDERIRRAFGELGHAEPLTDVCVIGMSQGATRAAALAKRFPDRYTRLVSMGAPTRIDTNGLGHLRAAVSMVGERERKDLMRASEAALTRLGVPATSLVIPDADHAGMGPTPETTMGAALDWLWQNSRESPTP